MRTAKSFCEYCDHDRRPHKMLYLRVSSSSQMTAIMSHIPHISIIIIKTTVMDLWANNNDLET